MERVLEAARADASDLNAYRGAQTQQIAEASAPNDSAIAISERLLSARKCAAALEGFPGTPPASLEEAYHVQQLSLEHWPDHVAGWNVGGIPHNLRGKLDADWLAGPIFDRSVKNSAPNACVTMPVFGGGFAAIEPELVVQLGMNRDEDRMLIGAEIASSPVPAINDYGPTAVVCDFGNNNGLLIGAEIVNWRAVKEKLDVSIWIDGKLIATRVLAELGAQASQALQFCLDHVDQQGRALTPGTLISTGAITGIHEAGVGAQAKISFGAWGELNLRLTQVEPLEGLRRR